MSNKSKRRLILRESTKTTAKRKKTTAKKQGTDQEQCTATSQEQYSEIIETRPAGAFGKTNYLREEKRVQRRTRKKKEMKIALGLICNECGELTGKSYNRPTLCEKCTLELEKSKEVAQ